NPGAGEGHDWPGLGPSRGTLVPREPAPALEAQPWIGACSGGAIRLGTVGRSSTFGACRSKGLVAGEHPPDRLGVFSGDGDGGDGGATAAAVAGAVAVDELSVGAVAGGGVGCFDQRPAEVVRPVFAECAAAVLLA